MDLTSEDVGSYCVAEIMGTELYTLTPDTVVASAKRLARENGIEHLLVLDNGTLTGIVCGEDLRSASRDALVGECMSSAGAVHRPRHHAPGRRRDHGRERHRLPTGRHRRVPGRHGHDGGADLRGPDRGRAGRGREVRRLRDAPRTCAAIRAPAACRCAPTASAAPRRQVWIRWRTDQFDERGRARFGRVVRGKRRGRALQTRQIPPRLR